MDYIKENGYREAWNAADTTEGFQVGGNVANLEAMLAKFGVVTVMDVELYDCVRFEEADEANGYRIGEWDAKSTFAAYKAAE
jgi:hypothetical protein